MGEAIVAPSTPLRLRRACERSRLEKQFLIDAYERLMMLVVPVKQRSARAVTIGAEGESSAELARGNAACRVGDG
jgi:hypothetical protein